MDALRELQRAVAGADSVAARYSEAKSTNEQALTDVLKRLGDLRAASAETARLLAANDAPPPPSGPSLLALPDDLLASIVEAVADDGSSRCGALIALSMTSLIALSMTSSGLRAIVAESPAWERAARREFGLGARVSAAALDWCGGLYEEDEGRPWMRAEEELEEGGRGRPVDAQEGERGRPVDAQDRSTPWRAAYLNLRTTWATTMRHMRFLDTSQEPGRCSERNHRVAICQAVQNLERFSSQDELSEALRREIGATRAHRSLTALLCDPENFALHESALGALANILCHCRYFSAVEGEPLPAVEPFPAQEVSEMRVMLSGIIGNNSLGLGFQLAHVGVVREATRCIANLDESSEAFCDTSGPSGAGFDEFCGDWGESVRSVWRRGWRDALRRA